MKRRLVALAALATLTSLAGCKKEKIRHGDQPKPPTSNPTVNLFGYEESQIHWMHYNIQRRGRVLLARFDPNNPTELQLLDCALSARWEYQDASGKHVESVHVKDQGELRARVPLGVARFSSYVAAGSELEFNYVTVGAYQLVDEPRVPRDDPACRDATHYVASLSVGAVQFDELQQLDAGVDVKVPGNVGGGGSAQHRKGATRSWGDVEACKTTADPSCHTPMQMMLIPLGERYWVDTEGNGSSTPTPEPAQVEERVAQGSSNSTIRLDIREEDWRPGYFMAGTLSKLLSFATYVMEETKYGLDGDATSLFGGYLQSGAPLIVGRPLKAGKEYVFFGASARDEDVDIYVADAQGNILAKDVHNDSQPVLYFTPPTDANYQVVLAVSGEGTETFGGMGIAVDDGYRVPSDMMQKVFQNMLNKGVKANQVFANNGFEGAVFLDSPGDWAMQATILLPGETITQRGVQIPANRAGLFMAVGHDMSMNIDLGVEDESGNMQADTEPDAEPVVLVDPKAQEQTFALKVQLAQAKEATLATSLILRDAK